MAKHEFQLSALRRSWLTFTVTSNSLWIYGFWLWLCIFSFGKHSLCCERMSKAPAEGALWNDILHFGAFEILVQFFEFVFYESVKPRASQGNQSREQLKGRFGFFTSLYHFCRTVGTKEEIPYCRVVCGARGFDKGEAKRPNNNSGNDIGLGKRDSSSWLPHTQTPSLCFVPLRVCLWTCKYVSIENNKSTVWATKIGWRVSDME